MCSVRHKFYGNLYNYFTNTISFRFVLDQYEAHTNTPDVVKNVCVCVCLYFIQTYTTFVFIATNHHSFRMFFSSFIYDFYIHFLLYMHVAFVFQINANATRILWMDVTNDLHCNVEPKGKERWITTTIPCVLFVCDTCGIVGAMRSIHFFWGILSEEFPVLLLLYWCCENSFKSFVLPYYKPMNWRICAYFMFIIWYAADISMIL